MVYLFLINASALHSPIAHHPSPSAYFAAPKNVSCRSFTYDSFRHDINCFLKDNADGRKPMSGRTSGIMPPAPPGPAAYMAVTIDTRKLIGRVSPMYVSFSLDTSSNRGWFVRNITDQRLINLASALSPAVLRVGGTGNNCLRYNVPSTAPKSCEDTATCCMNQSQWDDLNAFASATNTSLVFGLRASEGGNATDIRNLLQYTVDSEYKLFGLEYGNEIGCGTGAGFSSLKAVVSKLWSGKDVPSLVGPDPSQHSFATPNASEACVAQFFRDAKDSHLRAFTYHFYLQTHSQEYTATELDSLARCVSTLQKD
eukprot:m.382349 g.382349  ORF g.382349 m.382349 type:complete len:312 (+) comp20972_c0_seq7:526-1461(+)